jgi:hypothetical protein
MTSVRDDRRLFDRFLARFPVKFKDTRNDYGSNVYLRDVSAEGAKILSKQRMFINDSVTLEVELHDGHDPLVLRGQVVWSKPSDLRYWEIGLRFFKVQFINLHRLYKSSQLV